MADKKTKKRDDGEEAKAGALLQAFVDLIDAGDAQDQLILNALVRFADWRTGVAYPKYNTLAELAKCSRRTVQRRLRQMNGDLITLDERFDEQGSGRQTSNEITLVGYADWFAAVSAGGIVRKPKKLKKRRTPPGQSDQGAEASAGATPPGQVDQGDPLDTLSTGPGHQVSTPPGQLVSTLEPSLNPSPDQVSPPPPRKRGARERDDLIEQLRSSRPDCGRALEKLLAPLLALVRLDAPNPEFAAATLADFAEKQTDDVLAEAYRLLTEPGKHYRRYSAKPADITDAIRTARTVVKARESLHKRSPIIFRTSPDFEAAIAKVAEQNPAYAASLRGCDYLRRADLKSYGIEQVAP